MKKIKYLGITFLSFLLLPLMAHAAPTYSFYASSNYVTTGSNVTATLRLNNVASWQITITGNGATGGCTKSFADATGDAKNSTQYLSVTCKATNVGQIGFTVSGNATSADGSTVNISSSKAVVVQAPREKDSNNYLKSLSVKDYTLTPEFNKETLEYSITVPNTVDKVTIEAEKESNYATLEGTGEFEVNEGMNTFEVKVMSETGTERIYTVKVNVEDENPIEINVTENNSKYTIMKNVKNVEAPATYLPTSVKIKDFDIPAFYSETSKYTLIGVKDSKGEIHFAIYDKDQNEFTLYNENKSNQMLLYIKSIPEVINGFEKDNITINEETRECLVSTTDKNIILVYAMNIVDGKDSYYYYDKLDGTYLKYNDAITQNLEQELEKYKNVILIFGGVLVLFFLIIIILLFKKTKKKERRPKEEIKIEKKSEEKKVEEVNTKDKKNKKQKEEQLKQEEPKETPKEEPKKKKDKTKEDALEQVNNAAQIIEEFEKTRELSKKELKSIAEQVADDETMFDILGDGKKKKKK